MWIGVALIAVSLIGLAINLYFAALLYPVPVWVGRALGGAAAACGIDGGSCKRVVTTPYARLFAGQPNVLVGIPWCITVIVLSAIYLATGVFHLWGVCLFVAAASVLVGIYLTWVLIVKLREPCPL